MSLGSIREKLNLLPPGVRVVLTIGALTLLFFVYTRGITVNPPGFYIDEAAASYNAYTVSQSGAGDFGHILPVYFPIFPLAPPLDYLGYADPVQIYVLAAINLVFGHSAAVSRGLSAAAMFLLAIVLGYIGLKDSGSIRVGLFVWLMALLTPWFFETGRLAFGAALYPLVAGLFLAATHRANARGWTWPTMAAVAAALALTTYTYSIGRLLGPLFAFGLVFMIANLKTAVRIFLTWVLYALSLIPILVFHYGNPNALTGRFNMSVGYISPEKSYGQILSEFSQHFLANVDPYRLFVVGDLNWRHHIPDTPPLLAITVVLAIIGIGVVALKRLKDPWWRFVLFGTLAAVIPASLTKDDFHMLRLSPFPVFIVVLTIPVLAFLFSRRMEKENTRSNRMATFSTVLATLVIMLGIAQAGWFFVKFVQSESTRDGYFDTRFPKAFAAALEQPERPIYLTDQFYYHAFWQAVEQKVDLSNFLRLPPMERPPANSLVLSGEEKCVDCEMVYKDIPFVVYRTTKAAPRKTGPPGQNDSTRLSSPRGIALDSEGSYYVSDSGNSRVLKFSAAGQLLMTIGKAGRETGEMTEPNGLFVDDLGMIFVTDAALNKLMKYDPQGNFVSEWRPEGGFYGPREIAGGPDRTLYIVDQGRTRIVRFDRKSETFTSAWGGSGTGEGQFNEPTGIAVGEREVFVMDTGNERIQVFDTSGKFIRQWPVDDWKTYSFRYPDAAFDEATKRLYVTSSGRGEVLAFAPDGKVVERLTSQTHTLSNPSSIVIAGRDKATRQLLVLSTGSGVVIPMPISR